MQTMRSTYGRYKHKEIKKEDTKPPTYRQKFVMKHFSFLGPYIIPRKHKKPKSVDQSPEPKMVDQSGKCFAQDSQSPLANDAPATISSAAMTRTEQEVGLVNEPATFHNYCKTSVMYGEGGKRTGTSVQNSVPTTSTGRMGGVDSLTMLPLDTQLRNAFTPASMSWDEVDKTLGLFADPTTTTPTRAPGGADLVGTFQPNAGVENKPGQFYDAGQVITIPPVAGVETEIDNDRNLVKQAARESSNTDENMTETFTKLVIADENMLQQAVGGSSNLSLSEEASQGGKTELVSAVEKNNNDENMTETTSEVALPDENMVKQAAGGTSNVGHGENITGVEENNNDEKLTEDMRAMTSEVALADGHMVKQTADDARQMIKMTYDYTSDDEGNEDDVASYASSSNSSSSSSIPQTGNTLQTDAVNNTVYDQTAIETSQNVHKAGDDDGNNPKGLEKTASDTSPDGTKTEEDNGNNPENKTYARK